MSRVKTSLPESLATTVKATIADWQSRGTIERLWNRDATLWTGTDEANWLGWLDIVEEQIAQQDQLQKLAKEVQSRGFQHVLLLGMGGSSLCPEVLLVTGFASIRSAVEAMRLGAFDYLAKPADADDVIAALLATGTEKSEPPQNPMSADRVRWEHIQRIYEMCNRNVSETARRLNMHRRTLQRILAKRAPR